MKSLNTSATWDAQSLLLIEKRLWNHHEKQLQKEKKFNSGEGRQTAYTIFHYGLMNNYNIIL